MNAIYGFENLDKLKRSYQWFDIDAKQFPVSSAAKHRGGVPLMYDAENRKVVIDSGDTHTLVYGATGSLKTRTIVMPTIKILGYAGESMIINDSKGELHMRLAGELKKQGYDIVEINFRDPSVGNSWNPLYIPYCFYMEGDIDRSTEFANDIANNLMVSDRSSEDPFWDYSASDLLFGLILLLFRYCKDHNAPISAVNIGNLLVLRRTLFAGKQQARNSTLWKYASEDELVAASLSGSIYAPNDTMNSILSVFDQKMRTFTIQPTLLDMLANNDFDIADIGRNKTAVFLITPDEKTSYHRLVSLFVKESYEYLIYTATQSKDNKVDNRINYVLDEFSSLPKIADMPSMISAARSRDIKFLLVIQSQSSLKQRYAEEADTIISNCTNWIYFTSRELNLLKEISELCGMQKNRLPNISIYDLQHFSKEKREALVLAGRLKPAKVLMLDIDRFGEKKYTVLDYEKRERHERKKLTFELDDEIKKRFVPELPPNILNYNSPFDQAIPTKPQDKKFDVDDLVKRIDKRIAELEAEEAKGGQRGTTTEPIISGGIVANGQKGDEDNGK